MAGMNYETGAIEQEERLALPAPEAPRRRRWPWIVAAIVVLAVAAWFLFGGKKNEAARPAGDDASQAPVVTVSVPGRQTVARTVSATGTLAARRDLPIGIAGEGGMITRVLVEPGQWVKAGQVLATVDRSVQTQTAAQLAAQVSVARSDQVLAQAELDRAKTLVDRGFISKADLQRREATRDAAAARVKAAQASLAEARARNGRLDIRAPAAGLILTRTAEPGQIVSSGSGVLFRLEQDGQVELRAAVSESDLAGLSVGSRARVTPVGSNRSFEGEVWQISPVIDAQTRQGVVRIALRHDPALRPGGFATAAINGSTAVAPLLPETAILSDDKATYVYVVGKDNKVERRVVKTGEASDNGVAVLDGLNGTERVVLTAGAFLTPGQVIKPSVQKAR